MIGQVGPILLKAEFPLNIENEKATYDLGIGSIQRGNNTETAYEVYAQYWADLTDHDGSYGVSVMNDSKAIYVKFRLQTKLFSRHP